jgi:hypothetical protein
MNGFALLGDGRVVDLSGNAAGKKTLVLEGASWVPFKGYCDELMDAKPLTDEEAREIVSRETALHTRPKIS